MTTITCKIPERLNAQLEAAARAKRVSKSAIVRRALEEQVRRAGRGAVPSAYDLVKHLAGSVHGPRDLSTNPRHMEGFGG